MVYEFMVYEFMSGTNVCAMFTNKSQLILGGFWFGPNIVVKFSRKC